MQQQDTAAVRRGRTVRETAARWLVSEDHVWRLIANGELGCIRIPSSNGRSTRAARVIVPDEEIERAEKRWREAR